MVYGFNDDKSKAAVVPEGRKVAGVNLADDITKNELFAALGFKYGNVAPASAGLNDGDIYFYFPDMP